MTALYLQMIPDASDDKKSAFEEIYRQYKKRMLYAANAILHDPYESEDAVHKALVGIAKNIDKIKDMDERETFSYVMRAAQNAALSLRKRHREVRDAEELPEMTEAEFFRRLDIRETYEQVVQIIATMDPLYRTVLIYYYVEERNTTEIAKLLNCKTETVKKRLSRGRNLLIDLLKKEGLGL